MKNGSIVADASPLIYLAKADELCLLDELFEEVYVPLRVYEETQVKSYLEDARRIRETEFLKICRLNNDEELLIEKIHKENKIKEADCSVIAFYLSRGLDYALFANTDAVKVASRLNVNVINPFELGRFMFDEGSLEEYAIRLKSAGYLTKQMSEFLDLVNLNKSKNRSYL